MGVFLNCLWSSTAISCHLPLTDIVLNNTHPIHRRPTPPQGLGRRCRPKALSADQGPNITSDLRKGPRNNEERGARIPRIPSPAAPLRPGAWVTDEAPKAPAPAGPHA